MNIMTTCICKENYYEKNRHPDGRLLSPYSLWSGRILGQPALDWIDILAENGITIWQILPLNPTGYGNSPYQPYSSRAGDELYISLETLSEEGLLTETLPTGENESPRVEYEAVRAAKEAWLKKAYAAFIPNKEFEAFAGQDWVRDYCVFRAMKKANSSRCWLEWPKEQRDWPLSKPELSPDLEAEARYQAFLQYEFLRQWNRVRDYAHSKNIQIMGDVPFYVGIDSVDVWAGRENFLLDSEGYPTYIAGVPPGHISVPPDSAGATLFMTGISLKRMALPFGWSALDITKSCLILSALTISGPLIPFGRFQPLVPPLWKETGLKPPVMRYSIPCMKSFRAFNWWRKIWVTFAPKC